MKGLLFLWKLLHCTWEDWGWPPKWVLGASGGAKKQILKDPKKMNWKIKWVGGLGKKTFVEKMENQGWKEEVVIDMTCEIILPHSNISISVSWFPFNNETYETLISWYLDISWMRDKFCIIGKAYFILLQQRVTKLTASAPIVMPG